MATTTRQPVQGLRELGRALQQLKTETQARLVRRATGAGAKVVKEAVIAKAEQQPTLADKPYTHDGVTYQPGHVARNVIAKHISGDQSNSTSEHLVAVRSNKANGYAGRIAALNEFGTVKMAAQPFMRPGFEGSKEQALQAIVHTLADGIAAAARKAPKG